MTRENKLALVIGFGLILLVGILISDHFSDARRLDAAELTAGADTIHPMRREDPDLIALRDPVPDAANGAGPVDDPGPRTARFAGESADAPSASGVLPIDPLAGTPPAGGPGQRVAALPDPGPRERVHRVAPGESLGIISVRYYGTASKVDEIASHNGIDDPDTVQIGMKIRLPDLGAPAATAAAAAAPHTPPATAAPTASRTPGPASASSGSRLYDVREGDNLSKIARQTLGSPRRWRQIYEANRDVLQAPDEIRPGMTLKIPRS